MRFTRSIPILAAALGVACGSDTPAGGPTGADLGLSGSPVVESASGGYHFTTDPRFFGAPVENRLTFSAARHADGTISGGMIPKLETCVHAVEAGCEAAVVLDGRVPHAMLLEFFTSRGAGTLVRAG